MKVPDENKLTDAEKRAASKTKEALERTFSQVETPADAAEVMDHLESRPNVREGELPQENESRPHDRAEAISAATKGVRDPVVAVLDEAAEQVAKAPEEDKLVLDRAIGDAAKESGRGRRLLEEEVVKRLRPFDAIDTLLFVSVNNLPHPLAADRVLARLSWFFTGGHGWLAVFGAALLFDRRRALSVALRVMPAVWIATWLVERPIKAFFRRRRPFISIVRAIVVGRKPGNYSFPSGHSAAAFSGAVLLTKSYPRGGPFFFTLAALIGFSRVYLGAHYPGDVVSGGFLGAALARGVQKLMSGGKC